MRLVGELNQCKKPERSGLSGALERETGLEPATTCLEGRSSTTELLPRTRCRCGAAYPNCSKAQHAGQAASQGRSVWGG